jgi:uncharacterized protein YggE
MRLRPLIPLALGLLLLAAAPAAAQDPTQLVVVEVAEVRAEPDVASLTAQIGRTARSPAVARRRVERRVAEVLRALEAIGIPRADIRTSGVESYRSRRRGRTRHHAATTLAIRVADLDLLGRVVGALRGADIEGPDFSVSDETAARQEATRIALERARRRADDAAAALGQRVVAIRKVDLNPEFGYDSGYSPASGGEDESAAGGGGSVQIERGREVVAVAVAVVYEIGP